MSEQVALELNCAPLPLLAELACTATALLIPSWDSETLRYTPGRPRATIPPSKEAYRFLLRARDLDSQGLPKVLLVPRTRQGRHARHAHSLPNLQVGSILLETGIFLSSKGSPSASLRADGRCGLRHPCRSSPC